MRCDRCKQEDGATRFLISVVRADGGAMSISLCRFCARSLIGEKGVTGLLSLVTHAGWAQPALPGFA